MVTRMHAVVDAQNQLTGQVLEQCKTRTQFKHLLTKVFDYPRYSCPFKRGDRCVAQALSTSSCLASCLYSETYLCCRYYYSHNTGLQAQSVLYTQGSLQEQAEEFLDPNKWSSDGTVALCDYAFSKDGSIMAYSTGRSDISCGS